MSPGLIVVGGCLFLIAAISVVLLRRHDRTLRATQAVRHGWQMSMENRDDVMDRLRGLTLFEVGHSRRIEGNFKDGAGLQMIQYVCETGFEQRRRTHRWVVAVTEASGREGAAVISREDWLLAAAELPGRRRISIEQGNSAKGALYAIIEDSDEWTGRLSKGMADWLKQQPTTRSWEVQPGYVVAYDPGPMDDDKYDGLPASVNRFAELMSHCRSAAQAEPVAQ